MDIEIMKLKFFSGMELYGNGKVDEAITQLNSITYTDELIVEKDIDEISEILNLYSDIQLYLGTIYDSKNDKDKAITCYKNVNDANSEYYSYAQYLLSIIYLERAQYSDAKNCFKEITNETEVFDDEKYHVEIVKKVINVENHELIDCFYKLINNLQDILSTIFVDNPYEKYIAHYTNLTVSKLLLSKNDKFNTFELKSPLRLNTINLMNDPEEGQLLCKLLCLDSKILTQDSAFISCFTLHHDSLNQFRLYAKEKDKEATGLSLVLSKDFFGSENNPSQMFNKIAIDKIVENSDAQQNIQPTILARMPLYRCIYLDPTSGLIKVAQREEWSFHREYKAENKVSILDSNPEAEQHWQEYKQEMTQIETKVQQGLKELVKQIKALKPSKLELNEQELLAEFFLPLRYLIKHMAFKEEQECRMIYVTQMDNPLIKYDEKINRIYIDYEPSVMEHLEKIYLAPKAKDEKMVFEYLCSRGQEVRKGKPSVKVKISQNPFR